MLGLAECVPPGGCGSNPNLGNLEVLSDGNVAFAATTGFDESFFSSDNALGPAQLIPFSTQRLFVQYSDGFSTVLSQEMVLVMARDPLEYRTTLESIAGPTNDPNNSGDAAAWATQTFSCGDVWPGVDALPPPRNHAAVRDDISIP